MSKLAGEGGRSQRRREASLDIAPVLLPTLVVSFSQSTAPACVHLAALLRCMFLLFTVRWRIVIGLPCFHRTTMDTNWQRHS
jgi:hypothetical protein